MKNFNHLLACGLFAAVFICTSITAQSQSWDLPGNAGTDPALHFIGTTDNQPLVFRVNNERAGRIDPLKSNTFFGHLTFSASGTGQFCSAFGSTALNSNTTGSNNSAFGRDALRANTTGGDNSAFGSGAMRSNTSGIWNTAVGNGAMYSSTTGIANTALGDLALTANTTGSTNTAIGEDALRRNTTGGGNTALGENALNYNVTGGNNTGLGRSTSIINFTNSTALGYNATVTASNKIRLGNTTITSLESQVNLSVTSDGRYKKNFRDDVGGLDFILRLRPLTYNYDVQALNESYGIPDRIRAEAKKNGKGEDAQKELAALEADAREASQIRHTGFIAQEVEEAAAECGFDFTGVVKPQNAQDHYALRYAEFTVPLVKAVQEQQAIIQQQSRQIAELQAAMQALLAGTTPERSATPTPGSSQITVSPNPGAGIFALDFKLQNASEVRVTVLDQLGKPVLDKSLGVLAAGENHQTLDLHQLPSGTYFLHLTHEGLMETTRVLIGR